LTCSRSPDLIGPCSLHLVAAGRLRLDCGARRDWLSATIGANRLHPDAAFNDYFASRESLRVRSIGGTCVASCVAQHICPHIKFEILTSSFEISFSFTDRNYSSTTPTPSTFCSGSHLTHCDDSIDQSHRSDPTRPFLRSISSMSSDNNFSLVFGIFGTVIALSALSIAYLQLRRTRRVHMIYELAWCSLGMHFALIMPFPQ
jgi:hypothetical protein